MHAFIPSTLPLRTSSWKGTRLSSCCTSKRSAAAPSMILSRSSPLRRLNFTHPAPVTTSAPLQRVQRSPIKPLAAVAAALTKPTRSFLAFAARAAKRSATFRRRHGATLKLARMGLTLGLAVVSYYVTRGALSGVATVNAPALPRPSDLPFKLALPERLTNIFKPFTESFGVVFLSEFGDKSMFATALMAMKHNPFIVCIGAFAALTVMTFIACFLGQLMHLLPATVTHYSSIALFVFFGLQMILQSRHLPDTPGGAGGERADAEEMVAEAAVAKVQSPLGVLAKVSSLIFVAEWCDRSMLATMALAASSNTVAVIGGATVANILCTGVAVSAATVVASRISERLVALIAGILFEVFAVFTYLEGPEG